MHQPGHHVDKISGRQTEPTGCCTCGNVWPCILAYAKVCTCGRCVDINDICTGPVRNMVLADILSAPPRQMVSLDLLTQSAARPLKWFRNWDAAFSTDDFQVVYRSGGPIFNGRDRL